MEFFDKATIFPTTTADVKAAADFQLDNLACFDVAAWDLLGEFSYF